MGVSYTKLFRLSTPTFWGTTLEIQLGFDVQFIRDEHNSPLYSTTENVILGPNVEQTNRTIRLGVIGESGTISVIVDTLADCGLSWNLDRLHFHFSVGDALILQSSIGLSSGKI
jgi:hypothetical protein